HYADPAQRADFIRRLRRDGRLSGYELEFRREDGSTVWVESNSILTTYKGRDVAITSNTDLSERRRREQELRSAHETLEDAIEALTEGFVLWDEHDRFVTCNERYRKFNHLVADKLTPGTHWLDFISAGVERGQYVAALGEEETYLAHYRARGIKGAVGQSNEFQQNDGHWFEATNQRTRQGGTVGTRVDVTGRKRMERAVRNSEALVRQVLEACPVPILMTRIRDGRILYSSPATKKLFRMDGDEQDITTRYMDSRDRDRFLSVLRETGRVDEYEVELKRADESSFWGSISARLIEFRGENVVVSTTNDLTERKSVEAQMARQREVLHQSEKLSALGELLAGVAHELNNPLSVVVGQALLLQETTQDEATAGRAEKIGNAADRCARIVKTFLAMARQKPTQNAPLDLNEIVHSSLDVVGYSLRSSNVDLELVLADDLPLIQGDTSQLNQVLTNLILNAHHALQDTDGKRTLQICTQALPASAEVEIRVSDNGPGVPDEIQSRIFDPFFTTKDVGTGTGIGLAVCHRIVDSHGGAIKVQHSDLGGATFTVRFPTTSAPAVQIGEGASAAPQRVGRTILVVDDEVDVGEMLADILRADGHTVSVAASERTALATVSKQDFDIILSDIRMPDGDGAFLYERLKADYPHLSERIAFVTGDTLTARVKDFLESAERPYLEKPITPGEVRAFMHALVGE
ncbi:MAG: response regulator, partial [Gammaproteobacteria bacterium]|nr:response regulator [Gammaproteobacteria bacterium]